MRLSDSWHSALHSTGAPHAATSLHACSSSNCRRIGSRASRSSRTVIGARITPPRKLGLVSVYQVAPAGACAARC